MSSLAKGEALMIQLYSKEQKEEIHKAGYIRARALV